MLKDTSEEIQGIPLFITKLPHIGRWQRRFDIHMSSLRLPKNRLTRKESR